MCEHRPTHGQFAAGESFTAQRLPQEIILHDPNASFALRSPALQASELPGPLALFEFFDRAWTNPIVGLSFFEQLLVAFAIKSPVGGHGRHMNSQVLFNSLQAARNQSSIVRSEEHTSELQSQSNLVC